MLLSREVRILKKFACSESGTTLIETVVALALLSAIAVTFLSGLATTSKATIIANEQTTAESLARSQMEWVKNVAYADNATEYSPASIPGGEDYVGYSTAIAAEPLHATDDGIQKITVTIEHFDKEILKLEGYKADR